MRQIVHIVLNNIAKCKMKAIMIILLISFAMFISVLSYSFKYSMEHLVDIRTEELNSTAKIKIMSKSSEGIIPLSTLNYIESVDGVKNVIPQYNIGGLLEKEAGVPIYSVSINGFDFENNRFIGADDFRNQKIRGILLPDLTVSFGDNWNLKDLVGKDVLFTYEYLLDNNIVSKTVPCKVIGVYEAYGIFEENPVYMSMDLFSEILNDYAANISGVTSSTVYLESADYTEEVAKSLNELGVEVFYESTIEEYIKSLEGFVTMSMAIVIVILFLAVIIIVQTISANIRRRYTTIGVMKAYGYSNLSIFFLVWLEIFIYSVVSVLVAVLICLLSQNQIQEIFTMLFEGIYFTLNTTSILLLVGIAGLTSVLSIILPCRLLVKVNPIEVLKGN